MNTIEKHLSGLSSSKSRAVCYYLSRHLKQAAVLKNYSKDPFVEADSSTPDGEVITKTKELLLAIEEAESMTLDRFDDATYLKWMNVILEFERGLSTNSPPSQRVRTFLSGGA